MAKRKTPEELIIEFKEIFVERELNYLEKLLVIDNSAKTPEEISLQQELDKEELKFIKNLKSRLKYVEDLNNQLTGKTGKESKHTNEELWAKIVEMQSGVGKIVTSIPKTGTD